MLPQGTWRTRSGSLLMSARGALPVSELAALLLERNEELVKRPAEGIRKAADEYQRKMRVVSRAAERSLTDVYLRVERWKLGLRLTSARRQN